MLLGWSFDLLLLGRREGWSNCTKSNNNHSNLINPKTRRSSTLSLKENKVANENRVKLYYTIIQCTMFMAV